MKKIFIFLAAMFIASVSSAMAYDILVTLDNTEYNVGDTITATATFTGLQGTPDDWGIGGFDLNWEDAILDFTGVTYSGNFTITNSNLPGSTDDGSAGIESQGFVAGNAPGTGLSDNPLFLFDATFIALEAGDFTMNSQDYNPPGMDILHSNAFAPGLDPDVVWGSAGATVVPIPGAVILMGSGLLGLLGIRRRKG